MNNPIMIPQYGVLPQPYADVQVPPDKIVNTEAELQAVLNDISYHNSVLDFNWHYKYRPFYDDEKNVGVPVPPKMAGWLVWVEFERPDIHTAEKAIGRGRDAIIKLGATESAVVKSAYVLFKSIIEHETMEGFQYRGIRVFNPHHSVHELSIPALIMKAQHRNEADEAQVRNSVGMAT